MADTERKNLRGVQFHPEVEHTREGQKSCAVSCSMSAGCSGNWTMEHYATQAIWAIYRKKSVTVKCFWQLSGGVDSSVCAKLISRAVGSQLTCIFVDHGLMRKNEGDEAEAAFANSDIHFIRVNAEERFLACLAGVTDPNKNGRLSAKNLFACLKKKDAKSAKSIILHKVPSIPMSSKAVSVTRRLSVITMSEVCPQ